MKKEEIIPGDWQRILFGEAPPIFLLEVLLRTIVIYFVLLAIVRLMGKRMGGQLTISELAVMVTLGAIVAPGMQLPQIGVLLTVMVLICALTFQRSLNFAEYKSPKFEEVSQGTISILVKDGVINLDEMAKTKVSRQQLFSVIRSKHIYNLGGIDRVYLEACGMFSIYQSKEPAPGLSIFPPDDEDIKLFSQELTDGVVVCLNCGKTVDEDKAKDDCPKCKANHWEKAALERDIEPTPETEKR